MATAAQISQRGLPISAEAVLQVVSALYLELHPAQHDERAVGLSSHLERDLGFDSLGRVELVLRLERAFDVRLPDATVGSAETVADLLNLVNSAAAASVFANRPSGGTTPAKVALAPRQPLGTPGTARTLIDVLEWHAQQHPDAVHVVVLDGESSTSVTYGQLRAAARGVAGALQRAAVQPGANVERYLSTIARAHALTDLPDPTKTAHVKGAYRRLARDRPSSQPKAALRGSHIAYALEHLKTEHPAWDLRAKAILATAYCTMARRAELVALRVEDLSFNADAGDGVALIKNTKAGREESRYLSREAVTWLKA